MPLERLPDSTVALASELLERARQLEPRLARLPVGTPVAKTVGRARYWYLQSRGGGLDVQRYLGPENEDLLAQIGHWRRHRAEVADELSDLERLNDMVVAGGVPREPPAATRALELLAAGGLFRRGAVLVGTRAFAAYGPLLGFRAPLSARTQDIDVAVGSALAVALPREPPEPLATLLGATEPPFLPVPELDPRQPATSFKLRGRELRIDFVTERRRNETDRAVELPGFGLAAWPLELLDFLLEGNLDAVLVGARPVLVRVPDPSRFALHKLWLATERPTGEAARARKDQAQAETLLTLLVDERPSDLGRAATALRRHRRAWARVARRAERLAPELAGGLRRLLSP